jgi:hypothetical protein
VSLLSLLVQVVDISALWLFNLISIGEVRLSHLLWGHNLGVVHVNLVHSVVMLRSMNNQITA